MLATAYLLLGAVSTFAQDSARSWGEACGRGLVPNEFRTTYETDSEQSFRQAYCGEWFEQHQQEIEGSGGARILVFKIGADGRLREEHVTRGEFCGDSSSRTAGMTKWEVWAKTVSDDARREFFKCVGNAARDAGPNSPIVLGTMEETTRGLVASLRWDRNVTDAQPRFKSISTVNLTCTAPYAVGKKISQNPHPISCSWQNAAIDGQIIIETQSGGGAARSYERQFTRLGRVSLKITRDEDYLRSTNKAYSRPVTTVDMHDRDCINEDAGGLFGDLWRRIIGQLRGQYGAEFKPACFGERGGFDYPFTIVPDEKGRLTRPVGVECVTDLDRACAWNATHPIAVITERSDVMRLVQGIGSRQITVRGWATQEIWDKRPVSQALSWDLLFDGFRFTFHKSIDQRLEDFVVEWADRSSEAVSQSARLRLISETPDGAGTRYTYAVSLGPHPPAALERIGAINRRQLSGR